MKGCGPAQGPHQDSPGAEVDASPLFNGVRPGPTEWPAPPAGGSTYPTAGANAMGCPAQKIDHGPCWMRGLGVLTRDRDEHERAHDAGVAIATVMEVLIELLLLIGGVTVAAALLPVQPKVRLVLSFCGLVLVTVGGALFAFVTYPGETLLFLGAGAGISRTAWGYMRVTAWLARRAASATTLSSSASEPGSES